jgi:two-component system, sensor histidine kinase PdtaS
VLEAHKLEYGDADHVRLLLSITDVTDARATEEAKDELLRKNAILLQEVHHRVANSLQIIASILMQGARRVQSDEARAHLKSAHHRVLSLAAVQRQLVVSPIDDVVLRPYITQLCDSLAASMIYDPEQLSIRVTVDASVASSNVSVSLGLIVTELVINSLKHAFPEARVGTITVDYRATDGDWLLSVDDDGIGMPQDGEKARPGLGTGIVDALTRQLQADVSISDGHPGTKIRIAHRALAAQPEPPAAI